jgi:hypothetical protein
MNIVFDHNPTAFLPPFLREGSGEGAQAGGLKNHGSSTPTPALPLRGREKKEREGEQQAYVVFTGQADWPWLRWLKTGFRHCFVLLYDGRHWVSLDPLLNHTEVQVHNVPPGFDLPGWLEGRGHRVVKADIRRDHLRPAPFAMFSCVEAVKRVLGLHDLRILTPWQLYRYLRPQREEMLVPAG